MTAADVRENRFAKGLKSTMRASQPLRFVVVGGFNTALCYLVYAGLLWLGLVFWAANLGALAFGIALSFVTQGRLVFGMEDSRRFGRFIVSWLVIYVLQTGLIKLLMTTGISATWAGLIVLPGAAVASYLIQKRIVFRKSESGK